jgi:hypothetical protein
MDKKKAESGKILCPQHYDCELSASYVNTEVATQTGFALAFEILVPCILVTSLSFLFALCVVVFFFCKFHGSPHYVD